MLGCRPRSVISHIWIPSESSSEYHPGLTWCNLSIRSNITHIFSSNWASFFALSVKKDRSLGISPIHTAAKANIKISPYFSAAPLALLSSSNTTNNLAGSLVLKYLKNFMSSRMAPAIFCGPSYSSHLEISFPPFFFFYVDLSVLFVFCLNCNLLGLLIKGFLIASSLLAFSHAASFRGCCLF